MWNGFSEKVIEWNLAVYGHVLCSRPFRIIWRDVKIGKDDVRQMIMRQIKNNCLSRHQIKAIRNSKAATIKAGPHSVFWYFWTGGNHIDWSVKVKLQSPAVKQVLMTCINKTLDTNCNRFGFLWSRLRFYSLSIRRSHSRWNGGQSIVGFGVSSLFSW